MTGSDIIEGEIWQGSPAPLIARIRNIAGVYITQASLTSITYKVFDLTSSTPTTVTASGTLDKGTTVFDALQSDARWTVDAIGYNFLWIAPGTLFPAAAHKYRVEITFLSTDGYKTRGLWQPKTQPLLTDPL